MDDVMIVQILDALEDAPHDELSVTLGKLA